MNGYDSVERKVESKEKLESNRVGCCSSDRWKTCIVMSEKFNEDVKRWSRTSSKTLLSSTSNKFFYELFLAVFFFRRVQSAVEPEWPVEWHKYLHK